VLACKDMRRTVARFVLSVAVWSFLAPLALGITGTAPSACCRRNGKHHCLSGTSDMSGMSTDDLPGLRADSSDCPYRSQIATRSDIARPQVPAVSTLRRPSTSFVAVVDSLIFEPSLVTCNSQRGPPAFGSSQL
jgi:hypothetical protein